MSSTRPPGISGSVGRSLTARREFRRLHAHWQPPYLRRDASRTGRERRVRPGEDDSRTTRGVVSFDRPVLPLELGGSATAGASRSAASSTQSRCRRRGLFSSRAGAGGRSRPRRSSAASAAALAASRQNWDTLTICPKSRRSRTIASSIRRSKSGRSVCIRLKPCPVPQAGPGCCRRMRSLASGDRSACTSRQRCSHHKNAAVDESVDESTVSRSAMYAARARSQVGRSQYTVVGTSSRSSTKPLPLRPNTLPGASPAGRVLP